MLKTSTERTFVADSQNLQRAPLPREAINDLLAASAVALRAALKTDLPPITQILQVHGAGDGLSQEARRDLYAAHCLYGVRLGEMCAITRRPGIEDTQTLILPQGDAYVIVVLSTSGAAAIYAPNGRGATLVNKIAGVTKEMLEGWAHASTRPPGLGDVPARPQGGRLDHITTVNTTSTP
jgi:hypothetical protein